MAHREGYEDKLELHTRQPAFKRLAPELREFIRERARKYRFTFQEVKLTSEAALDLAMWGERPLSEWWVEREAELTQQGRVTKKLLFDHLGIWLRSLRTAPKAYPEGGLAAPPSLSLPVVGRSLEKKAVGLCPVASEETVCCNLRTIDAVENCGFSCSYCTIQTFYGEEVVVDTDLGKKLQTLELDPTRFYHLGTGQSSDALMWGNRYGLLDTLCEFAGYHPNVLLELKTKSRNVAYFLENEPPRNVVLSWSLNTPTIIDNEEHFAAPLGRRLEAARQVAGRGIKVAFHFHPIVYYENWRREYVEVADSVLSEFSPEDVLFLSFGTVTFIKPVIQAIRQRRRPTKMLQMELVPGPKGKLSYPDSIKTNLFREVYQAFSPWHGEVFMYLCMEKAELWQSTFGRVYESNEAFESDFLEQAFDKI
jgi:spore photoproduct lyase